MIETNFPLPRYVDVSLPFTPDPGVTSPDLTGKSLTFIVTSLGNKVALITKSTGAGITLAAGTTGDYNVLILAADTQGLAAGTYRWSVRITDAGSRDVLAGGLIELTDDCGSP